MLIFQKNFNNNGKTFDPLAWYRQQQAQNSVFGNQTSASSSAGKLPDGASNGTGVHVQAPQPGDPNFDWGSTQFGNPNNFLTQEVIKANRKDAGLDPNLSGEKSGLGQAREWLQKNVGKPSGGSDNSSSQIKFDQEALRKQFENQGMSSDQIDAALAQAKASYDAEVAARAVSSQKVATPTVTKPSSNKPVVQDKINKPSLTPRPIQDVPEIDTTVIEEEELPALSADQQAKVDRIKKMNATKGKIKQGFSNAKTKAVETWGKWSDNYGDGLTGSLAGDAALAAGGLALAGGAYHLLKKRRAKKKAEKEALENRIKK